MANQQTLRLPLTPTLSRNRERGRAAAFITAGESLLPLAGEGGAKRRMKVGLRPYHAANDILGSN
jgi:hypothetical protein